MFDFGKNLADIIKRIVTGVSIDKKVVEEILQDLKKTLLQADVDIKLTEDIIKNIRKKCLEEKIPAGLTLREYVLKVIYEELVKVLGEKPFSLIGKKRIMFVGLFGSGKCVHPESLIPLADGNVLSAREFYEKFSVGCPKEINEEAEIVDVSGKNIFVPSFDPESFKIENKKVTHLWKLRGKELLDVYLDNGNDFSVKVTPEHPFFVLRSGQLKQTRADELNEDDFVAVPRNYSIAVNNYYDLLPQLKNLDLEVKVSNFQSNKSIKEIHRSLPFKRNYCVLTSKLKRGIIPISLINGMTPTLFLKYKNSKKFINFPRYLTLELAELLGYVFGDGHLDVNSIEIVSESEEIIERVKELTKKLFGLETKIERDLRTKAMNRLRVTSKTLVNIISKIFGIPIGRKGRDLKIPKQVFLSDLEVSRQFIKAYFDCDASPSNNTREIELCSESKFVIKGMQVLLLRFGILSSISKKTINGTDYWRLFIRARYAEAYAQKIGFRINSKEKKANKYLIIGSLQGCGKQDMIPLGKVLYETRMSLGFSIGEIQKYVNSYGRYEKLGLISRESLLKLCRLYRERKVGFIFKLLLSIKNYKNIYQEVSRHAINGAIQQLIKYGLVEKKGNLLQITQKGFELLNRTDGLEKLHYLEKLALADVCWLRVRKIVRNKETSESLYDFTVEQTHSFIADGIIVHNTTSIAKLAKYFQKQGLRPALVSCDFHRPAALEQLAQLGKQINVPVFFEKDPYTSAKLGIEKFKNYDAIIFDTAGRDALDKELAEELKKLGEIIKPDEVLLTVPADIGKVAGPQADEFNKLVGITGVVITRMDGTAKGGGALASCSATGAKVKFIGTGEHLEDFEVYNPERFVSRLLGLGDLQTLLEKAKEAEIKPEKVEKIVEGKFTLQDFLEQIEALQKIGPLQQIAKMIPGFGMMKIPEELLELQQEKMKNYKYIIQSMTKEEKENPEIISASRIKRIARGSGRSESEVRELLNQYNKMKKLMKTLGGKAGLERGAFKQLAKKFGFKL